MSLQFLNMKSWHPANKSNQKRIWIAEQKAKDQAQREKEAAAEVRQSAELQRYQQLAAAKGDADAARRLDAHQVGFLYAPPPGLEKKEGAPGANNDDGAEDDAAEDDAARAFLRKMERKTKSSQSDDPREMQRNLERYVGRRPDENLTIKAQVERFPFLKNAPVEGEYTDAVKVNFQPVGVRLRNVRCMRCNEWGHQSGDRECALRDVNPHDAARQRMEDPMAQLAKTKRELVLRKASLPLEMQEEAGHEEFEILLSDEDDEPADPEKQFIAQLSSREKRALLKKLKHEHEIESHRGSRQARSASHDSSKTSDSDASRETERKSKRKSKKHKKLKKERRSRDKKRKMHSIDDESASDHHPFVFPQKLAMSSKTASKSSRSAKHAARQQQQQLHAPFESSANAPVRVYPPDASRTSAVAASPLMQMLQKVSEPVPVVGILSASYDSSERACAFANRLIGRYAFHPSEVAAPCAAPKDATPLLASVHLYFDAAKPCAYLLGVVRPESQSLARDASATDTAAFERERFKVQLLLHTCCSMLFVLQESSRVSPTLLRDVRALASEKQVVLTQLQSSSASSSTGSKGSKKSSSHSSASALASPFAPGRCVPLVLYVVPAPDAVLNASLAPAQSSKTRSAIVTYCKAYEAKLTTLCRSVRGGLVGSLRMRDALTATNLSKERRVFSLDPSQCVVAVSNRTVTASGQLDARLDELLESLEFGSADESGGATEPDLDALLAPLDDDDTGLPRAAQYMNRFVDLLLASNGSLAPSGAPSTGSSAGTKDAVRIELLSLAHWLKAFHGVVKTLQRIETKRKHDAATATEQHMYSSSDFA